MMTSSTVEVVDKLRPPHLQQPQQQSSSSTLVSSFTARRIMALAKAKREKLQEGLGLLGKSAPEDSAPGGWIFDKVLTDLDVEILAEDLGLQQKRNNVNQIEAFLWESKRNKLKEALKNNKHYFVSWLGFSVDEDDPSLDSSEAATYLRRSPEKVDELLQSLFNSYNCFRSSKKIAEHAYTDDGSGQILVLFFVEAYIAIAYQGGRRQGQVISGGEIWSPDRLIKVGKDFGRQLEKKGMNPDYLPGVDYLYKYTNLHNVLSKGKPELWSRLRVIEYNRPDEEFELLPGKSKALVMAAESLMWSAMRTMIPSARGKCSEVLKEMLVLDPDRYEWHYQIGSYLRLARRRLDDKLCISDEEQEILWATYDKCQYKKFNEDGSESDLRRKAFAGILQGLAEKIRFLKYNRILKNKPFMFGELKFEGVEEGVQYIMDGIKRIMANIDNPDASKSPNYAESIRCGDILSSILPYDYHDYYLAEKYFLHALTKAGTYSKIYHKLGVLYSRDTPVHNPSEAVKYLRLCYSVDPTNVPGATDLVKALMRNPQRHAIEIRAVISEAVRSPAMSKRDETIFYFIEGCLLFLLGNGRAAIESWMSADKCVLETGKGSFRGPLNESIFALFDSLRGYRWNWFKLNPTEIMKTMDEILKNSSSDELGQDKIEFLEKSLKFLPAMASTRPFNNYNNNKNNKEGYDSKKNDAVQRRARCISEECGVAPPLKPLMSDQDGNWRGTRNRGVDLSSSGGNSTSTSADSSDCKMYSRRPHLAGESSNYQQQNGKRNWHNNNNNYQNHQNNYNRRQNYQTNDNKSRQRRSPSPESWR